VDLGDRADGLPSGLFDRRNEGIPSVFLLTCPTCRLDYLVGARSVRRLHNVRPGVIVAELSCPQGHRVLELTGSAGSIRRADVMDRRAG